MSPKVFARHHKFLTIFRQTGAILRLGRHPQWRQLLKYGERETSYVKILMSRSDFKDCRELSRKKYCKTFPPKNQLDRQTLGLVELRLRR